MKEFKIDSSWGPPRLRAIFKSIEDAINLRTPLPSESSDVNEKPDGMEIIQKAWGTPGSDGDVAGGGGGGTASNLYGALNGAPATFHLLQSSAPTPL